MTINEEALRLAVTRASDQLPARDVVYAGAPSPFTELLGAMHALVGGMEIATRSEEEPSEESEERETLVDALHRIHRGDADPHIIAGAALNAIGSRAPGELRAERDRLREGLLFLGYAMSDGNCDRIREKWGGNTPEDWCGEADALHALLEERSELRDKVARLRELTKGVKLERYHHGGGRFWRDGEGGTRDLLFDAFGEDQREALAAILVVDGERTWIR